MSSCLSKVNNARDVAGSPLFNLPQEIRDAIYRLVLVTDDELWITKAHGIPEHVLLSVSKTVRSETLETFYLESNFYCEVSNFNHAAIELAFQKKRQLNLDPARTSGLHDLGLNITGQRN